MSRVFAAVIIPTRGRDQCVRDTLSDLAIQSNRDFEVWLVDQNEKPLEGLDRFLSEVRLIHEPMPALGSHAGRNRAIFKTEASWCVFVDDDVRLAPDFMERHLRSMREASAKVGAIAGRVVQPRDGLSEEQMRKMGELPRYNRWLGMVSGNFVGNRSGAAHHIHECNFSARTAALLQIGGFNEEFRGNAYFEGADLALRLIAKGFEVVYDPGLVLTHLQDGAGGNRVQEKARHTYWYMRNYGLLNSLHMRRAGLPLYAAFGAAYVAGKAIKNADPEIFWLGAKGLVEGLGYFAPGVRRFTSTSGLKK